MKRYEGRHAKQGRITRVDVSMLIIMIAAWIIFCLLSIGPTVDVEASYEPERIEPCENAEMPSEREKTASEAILEEEKLEIHFLLEQNYIWMEELAMRAMTEPAYEPLIDYTDEDVMAVTNMVYNEIGGIVYDICMTDEEKDLMMQEWANVVINHIGYNIGNSPKEVICARSGKYYVWLPFYATEECAEKYSKADFYRYERCRENVLKVFDGEVGRVLPENVIYADSQIHGHGAYKSYDINTGYFQTTVYLSYA